MRKNKILKSICNILKSNLKKRIVLVILIFLLTVFNFELSAREFNVTDDSRKGLVIIGDAWHSAAQQYIAIVKQMEKKGIKTDVIYDYKVPFDKLDQYDIIVISRWGLNDLYNFKEGLFLTPEWKENIWMTREQENKIEEYVKNGGNLFLHHAGHAYYSENGGITRLAKATHEGHPPRIEIEIYPTGDMPELTNGIQTFSITDEEYRMEIDESTTVFLKSQSEKNGVTNQGWVHDYGSGKVVVLVPGHDSSSLRHKSVKLLISNVIDYLVK